MNSKKLFLLAVALLSSSLVACGNPSTSSSSSETSSSQVESSSTSSNEESSTSLSLKEKYDCITIEEAKQIAISNGSDEGSEKYYVYGTIKEIKSYEYGEMTIEDETGEIGVWGTRGSDGTTYFDQLENRPSVGDEVVLLASLNVYNETPQIKIGALIEFVHHEVEIDVSEHVYKTVAEARNEADGAKLLLEGVVVSYTYNINMGKTGVYLVDSTSSIYVYGMDVANNVKIGDKIKVAGIKDYYILDKEQSNAAKFGYIGSNQLTDSQLVSVISSNNEWDKSWVEEKTVKELHETPFEEDITTKIYKTNALVTKKDGQGFVNYYINDIDGKTGSYVYTQASGADFSWLDEFHGKICTVYFTLHNAKAEADGAFYRYMPIEVSYDNYSFDLTKAPDYALTYEAEVQFEKSYAADPSLEVVTNVDSALLGFEGVEVTYTSSNTDALNFVEENDKTVMHVYEVENDVEVTVSMLARHNGHEKSSTVKILVKKPVKIEGISVKEAIDTEDNTEVTVKGIVLSSLVNQSGFYLIDETGVIAVRTSDSSYDKQVKTGDLVSIKGTKTHVRPNPEKCIGQIAIDSAVLLANAYGEHEIPTDSYNYDETLDSLYDFSAFDDHSAQVYVVRGRIEYVETDWYTTLKLYDPETNQEFGLYMSGAGQYAFLEPFYNQTVTMAIALCDWNEAKFYKGCIISVMTETETIYNSLNFSNN